MPSHAGHSQGQNGKHGIDHRGGAQEQRNSHLMILNREKRRGPHHVREKRTDQEQQRPRSVAAT